MGNLWGVWLYSGCTLWNANCQNGWSFQGKWTWVLNLGCFSMWVQSSETQKFRKVNRCFPFIFPAFLENCNIVSGLARVAWSILGQKGQIYAIWVKIVGNVAILAGFPPFINVRIQSVWKIWEMEFWLWVFMILCFPNLEMCIQNLWEVKLVVEMFVNTRDWMIHTLPSD